MKKRLIPLLGMLGFSAGATAQQVELQRSVVSSTGGSAQINNTIVQYTIGEVLVEAIANSPVLVTQGFQQPEVAGNETEPEIAFVNGFIVYPNPASGSTNLEFDMIKDGMVNMMLVNNAGQTIRNISAKLLAGKVKYAMPIGGVASGLYYVVLQAGSRRYSEKLVIQ
jgi:hypothetical protein